MNDVTRDITYLQTLIVNVFFIGEAGAPDRGWTLVDAGMPRFTGAIVAAARRRFGEGSRPNAIVLTHGHFDHVGSLKELAELWDVPVYAHALELPFLTGRSDYPAPDPTVGGGLMALSSPLFPRKGIDLGARVQALPEDGTVPGMAGWRWIHTPGHAPGHVSLWRESDRALIVGDAFTTVKQESLFAVATQWQEIHGPPSYFTIDWPSARRSVEELAALRPEIGATGHGVPMRGPELRAGLDRLLVDWEVLAVPRDGRYVRERATWDENGIASVPPAARYVRKDTVPLALALGGIAALGVVGIAALASRARSGDGSRRDSRAQRPQRPPVSSRSA